MTETVATPRRRPARTGSAPRRRRVRAPRAWPVTAGDVVAVVAANAVLVTGMWVRHGGLSQMSSAAGALTGLGQITALLGTYGALVQIVLMSRSPWLDQLLGIDGLAVWHRRLGIATTLLILGHVVLTTAGYALGDGSSLTAETWTLLTTYPYVLMAAVATALLVMVVLTSVRAARRRLRYETWHFIHLYAYLAIALAFGHELAVGSDLASDPVARDYWLALYAVVVVLVAVFRVGHPLLLSTRHRLRVADVVDEAPDVVSIHIAGRRLEELAVSAGQFFKWRFLARDTWWHAHPLSLSAAPDGVRLRITAKALGPHSGAFAALEPGTRVMVEGPFGRFTATPRVKQRTLLVAGGIGITPLRALLEDLPAGKGSVVLLYRVRSEADVVFRDELEQLVRDRGGVMHVIAGRRGTGDVADDPLGPRALRHLVPDARQRDAYVCGPPELEARVVEALGSLGVPDEQIHREHFEFIA